ncbi:Rab5, putative [Perkinsus marinus ATCC 50983]|uniref:Rab5, putative n=1 Tax=Perkinsus marinus (strain ATCC 50983 / TXsc) TaxID=423536 RepID=C5L8L6_PERM5|nr:Rab5, putative [Perkinsus marinus ATCC 50983]EER06929.1 Rab5, putative [Perkinsus marinus ATCC 50983]|eukprot:XP_002775113.1 Rab5, putative [Perkinsus marinus ATCC 50983]
MTIITSPSRKQGYKLVLLGDASVGKTSLVQRFVHNSFEDTVQTTIGAAFSTQDLLVPGSNRSIKFEIWDTAGQERFRSLAPMYYRNASCAIVVYDQTSMASFVRAQDWVKQLSMVNNPDIVVALAANKMDVADREVPLATAREYAMTHGLVFCETSAKTERRGTVRGDCSEVAVTV